MAEIPCYSAWASAALVHDHGSISPYMVRKHGTAAGPDRINGNILKLCKEPSILCKIFQQLLDSACMPTIWKTAELIAVPQKSPPTNNNDYWQVALTSIIMKCFERIVKTYYVNRSKSSLTNFNLSTPMIDVWRMQPCVWLITSWGF